MTIKPQPKSPTMRDAKTYRIDSWRHVTVLVQDQGSGWGADSP